MLALTARQKAIARGMNPRIDTLAEFRLSSGTEYYWSGSGILEHDGKQWLGCGLIADIQGVEASAEPGVSSVTFVVSGLSSSAGSNLIGDLKGQTAVIYDAFMDGNKIDSAVIADEVDLDNAEWVADDEGAFTVRIRGQSGYWQLELASDEVWSPEAQDARFPGDARDTGLDGLGELEDLVVPWTRT